MASDFYNILGVAKNASPDEIKRAYRKLARQFHPDVNKAPDAHTKFKTINEAYEVLSNPQKRAQYDQFGKAGPGFPSGGGGGFQGADFEDLFRGGGFGGYEDFGMGDLFESFFGGQRGTARRGGRRAEAGDDLRYDLSITLEEAAFGAEHEVEYSRLVNCAKCKGSGAEPGTSPKRCGTCGGAGQVQRSQRTILGSFTQVTTCPSCRGAGEVISTPCHTCKGNGRMRDTHKVKVKIPPGVESGMQLRLSREGNAGPNGGPSGNLYVFIRVKHHKFFERDGDDILYKTLITVPQVILGDEIEVPTLEGKAKLKIPPGTQSHTTFKLTNKGIPHIRGRGFGDQLVTVIVEIPKKLTGEQEELMRQFAAAGTKKKEPPKPGPEDPDRKFFGLF